MNKLMCVFALFLATFSTIARAGIEADVAYDRVAYRLELVRNQVELAIHNHGSLAHDLKKQEREFDDDHGVPPSPRPGLRKQLRIGPVAEPPRHELPARRGQMLRRRINEAAVQ